MYIETIPNRNSPPAILLRESFREDGKVKKRTIANLSHLDSHIVENLRRALRGGSISLPLPEAFSITQSSPHGHVAAVFGTIRNLGIDSIFSTISGELGLGSIDENDLYEAMDWLLLQQPRIEDSLAGKHLHDGC
ncbi:MAG: hypothetical protein WA705_23770 [Candidatus Ozemobacteraceae bacterium]